jgi:hypothetical protein
MQRKEIADILGGATLIGVGVTDNQGKVTSIVLHLKDGKRLAIGDADGDELVTRMLEDNQQIKEITEKVIGATSLEELRKIETEVFGDSPISEQK